MRWRVAVFGTLGALATLAAAGFVLLPETALAGAGGVLGGVSRTDPTVLMLAATGLVGLYVAVAARSTTSERMTTPDSAAERRFEAAIDNPPEAVTADRRALTAARLDADVESAIESGGESLQTVRQLLADVATEAYAEARQTTPERAREAVGAGTWTDDGLAAAFLGGADGPSPSRLARTRLWLTPERERERRIERALDAVAELQAAHRTGQETGRDGRGADPNGREARP